MKSVRRVIVAQNPENQSYVVEDKPTSHIDHFITGVKEAISINLWRTIETPVNLSQVKDITQDTVPFLPASNGTVFRICEIPPDVTYMNKLDQILLNGKKISSEQRRQKHPLMHKIDVLSYAIVLQGKIRLVLDKNDTLLKAGDVVVDCGSHHAWSNPTDKICRIAFILIDAKR